MRYAIIRDDDTNACTPPECLERLYRPFLDRGLPVCLATIPDVSLEARKADGSLEGFLLAKNGRAQTSRPIGSNLRLIRYLLDNPGYHVVQHGLRHEFQEFDSKSPKDLARRLETGAELLTSAGFPRPETFVAPHDKLSRMGMREVAARFRVISTGWFELRRLPYAWWPGYVAKKLRGASNWRFKNTLLLSHPGCLLSCNRDYRQILTHIKQCLAGRQLTVLVTHWWEYFRDGKPDEPFIAVLHETAEYLAREKDLRVVTFKDLVAGGVPLG